MQRYPPPIVSTGAGFHLYQLIYFRIMLEKGSVGAGNKLINMIFRYTRENLLLSKDETNYV